MMNDSNSAARPLVGDGGGAGRGLRGRLNGKVIGLAVLVLVAVSFFFQNGGRTRIWFLAFSFTSKTRTAIIVAFALGVIVDRLFARWWNQRSADRSS